MSFYEEITELILSKKIQTKQELHNKKIVLCKKYNIDAIPADSKILSYISQNMKHTEQTYNLLRKKPMRTISGVSVIAVMTSPNPCPHGRCIPCPGGPDFNTPQSYTGHEPAAMRGSLNGFDPYLQTKNRLHQLRSIGHPTEKIDLIIMGGTFTSRLFEYQQWFVKRCYDALNNKQSTTLHESKQINENAHSRCIGLTIETRPDWFCLHQADTALYLGATRVELGVQSIHDDVLVKMKRGHTVFDIVSATRIAKESGFKVCYHLMPGLPGSDENNDLISFKRVFEDDQFQPDMIKIYPTLVIKGTELYEMWKSGEYMPLTSKKASVLIAKMKECVPEWVRIQRIQRDVPAQMIEEGVKKSNLRQYVQDEMHNNLSSCRCIRCREIGHASLKNMIDLADISVSYTRYDYQASNGTEIFLCLEDKKRDVLIGYLRLRDIVCPHRYELQKQPCMIIRELKILGRELSLGKRTQESLQHRGYGKQLIEHAQKICSEEFDKKRLFVLSGVGVKQYYRLLGFSDNGYFLSKSLS
ncbi:MAG: tRNA uridine(34) 5-carboxymethylaminomethyl modification radical SAM/GNAT enzyme Elp3 [Thermoplasmatota archaeon]